MNDTKPPRRLRPAPPAGSGPPVIPAPRPAARPVASAPATSPPAPAAPAAAHGDPARKLIRPSLDSRLKRQAAAPTRRREAPPDATGDEAALLARLSGSGTIVAVRLETGETLRGRVEWADRTCLKLRREERPSVLVMKHAIVALEAEAGGRRG